MSTEDDEAKLALLTTRKEYIFRELQILYDLSKDIFKDRTKIGAFKSRYKRIESIRAEFVDVVNEINISKFKLDPKYKIDYNSVESFDLLYYAVQAAAEELLTSLSEATAGAGAGLPGASGSVPCRKPTATGQVKLDKLQLVHFDGNLELWQTFYDTFVALVHNNSNITPIEKFFYLLSCLSGSALSVVKGVPVTADNYPVIFNALVNRFQNKRLLATNYLDKICTYPPMKGCNLNELRNMTSLLYESVNALKAVKIENLGEFVLFYLASRILDFDTRKRFESQNREMIPSFENLLQFLQDYVKILEASESLAPRLTNTLRVSQPRSQPVNLRAGQRHNNVPQYRAAYHTTSTGGAIAGSYIEPWTDSSDFRSGFGLQSDFGPQTCSEPITQVEQMTHVDGKLCTSAGPYLDSESYMETSFGPFTDPEGAINSDSYTYSQGEQGITGTYAAVVDYNNAKKFPDCYCCGFSHHGIYKCPLFHAYDLASRYKVIRTKGLCVNCLRPNHSVEKCVSKSSCGKCNSRHHTLLHESSTAIVPSKSGNTSMESEPRVTMVNPAITMTSASTSTHVGHSRSLVLLGTCTVRAQTPAGLVTIRALIDNGAQDCFMTTACARRLGLPLQRCNITVAGLGQNTVHQIKGVTSCTIQPCDADNPSFDINPIVMDTITNQMPTVELPSSVREACRHLKISDANFDKPNDIELLLGAELSHALYDGQRLVLGSGLPVALHSVFGWVITGKLETEFRPPPNATSLLVSTLALDQVVKRFWEIEELPATAICNPEDEKCEKLYSSSVKRNPDGRYVVPILLKEPCDVLGDSYDTSLNRLLKLEKRLAHNTQLKEDYVNFMREYSSLGHMQYVKRTVSGTHIIPHHCVLRPQSMTTSLRVVFDCSAKTSNGLALNDIVYTGPRLQNHIVDIITNFRIPRIVFTADIAKMYRNIELQAEDRKYQHVLWRDEPTEPVREYELNTVTYGVTSSPYLAIRTLHQLAKDHGAQWPQAASILKHDTFMDDITAGAPSVCLALNLKDDLVNLLNCGKFELRKWSSNSPEFLAKLPAEHCQVLKSFCDETNQLTLKILGIQWDPVQDIFTYAASEFNSKCTKRAILSDIARIYDPVGWLTPVVLVAKLLLQDLWRFQLDWDDPVPEDIEHRWNDFRRGLQDLPKVRIPRHIVPSQATQFELIGFCDGSTKAYGCCVYLRSSAGCIVTTHLLIAKSRVAPLKVLTVNRLELLAAALLSRILKHMVQLLQSRISITKVTAMTDSSTVLAWLNTAPHKLKTFVSHRVVKITEEVSIKNWLHVTSHDNVADLCSRGLSCSQLASNPSWWCGPKWLIRDSDSWPVRQGTMSAIDVIPKLKPSSRVAHPAVTSSEVSVIGQLMETQSSFSRVQRIIAWCLRFINNSKSTKEERRKSGLTVEELDSALQNLIKREQKLSFDAELSLIRRNKPCNRDIQRLNPYLDKEGILRVGGRLQNSNLARSAINPVLLSKPSRLSSLLVDYFHKLYLHCGPRMLQSLILRKFWIIGIRNLIRSRLSKCVICFKVQPKPCQPLMGQLPRPRVVKPSKCFERIGTDFSGPFTLKESRRRNARTYKVYVCVTVCLAVKAINLDIVSDLSTPAFLAALDRFVSRRGYCRQIISDCGSNFIGARRYLAETQQFLLNNQSEITSELAKRGIIWHLNPPTGSHFGGIFESGVRSMKYHLKRVVGLQTLTYEEFITVLAKIEAVLNSRPLCVISTDPGEVDVLTPGHFLTGGPLVSLPEPQLHDLYIPPRERWLMLQKLTQSFWRVWQKDYLHTLQQRSQWIQGQTNLKIGDIVMIVDQNLPPLEWRSGQVIDLHPGDDGVVRVVTLKTNKGSFRRPVTKLCPLPLAD